MRPDFNVVFALLAYYIWKADKSKNATMHLMWAFIVVTVIDLLYFLIAMYVWGKPAAHDEFVWGQLSNMHSFSLFLSFIGICVKGLVIFVLYDKTGVGRGSPIKNMNPFDEKPTASPNPATPEKPAIIFNPQQVQ